MSLWKNIVAVAVPSALLLTGCASEQTAAGTSATGPTSTATVGADVEIPEALAEPLDVALVTRITTGSWYETYARAVTAQVDAFGGSLQVYDSNNDLSRMASNVDTAVNSGVDVLLVNNGTAEALDGPVQAALDAGIVVLTYDSDLTLDGITAINQDDAALAGNGLDQIAADLGDDANLVVLSVAGYPPLDRRAAVVDSFLAAHTGTTEVARIGQVSGNSALDTQAQVDALLKQYPQPGQIDAIWSHWNEFTRGAFEALKQAGRTDVAVYSVDLTDQELPYFWDEGVNFVAASATNPATIGQSQVRLAYQKVAGEDVGTSVEVEPALVLKKDLPAEPITFAELADVVPAWSSTSVEWPEWVTALELRSK
ncbi:sugar ABC transporter substrate-binding protein [Cellulomonas sp. P22]|uniref:sugar ABC transporter substrate-binding protein n=1 Tax=Cellulomonas sp. P22 TaxID=3373189 RepID=UPI0037884BF1